MEKLAILGGKPAKTTPTPLWPVYDENEKEGLLEVLESRVWWRTPGTKTKQFEEEFAKYHQAKHRSSRGCLRSIGDWTGR